MQNQYFLFLVKDWKSEIAKSFHYSVYRLYFIECWDRIQTLKMYHHDLTYHCTASVLFLCMCIVCRWWGESCCSSWSITWPETIWATLLWRSLWTIPVYTSCSRWTQMALSRQHVTACTRRAGEGKICRYYLHVWIPHAGWYTVWVSWTFSIMLWCMTANWQNSKKMHSLGKR